MPGLFEQFPHTNLHELNLDWIIDLLNQFKEELENSAVLSVNGQTGHVTLYESENVILPPLPEGINQWRLVRLVNGQYVGILFYNGNAYLQRGNSTMRLLTQEDIPTSSGVVSWNGLTGVVNVTGVDIKRSATNPVSIDQAITNEHVERVNADNAINNSINSLIQKMGTKADILDIGLLAASATKTLTHSGVCDYVIFGFSTTSPARMCVIPVSANASYTQFLNLTPDSQIAISNNSNIVTITNNSSGSVPMYLLFLTGSNNIQIT